jgi:hypothetical protein
MSVANFGSLNAQQVARIELAEYGMFGATKTRIPQAPSRLLADGWLGLMNSFL